jgi:hypothetical protein
VRIYFVFLPRELIVSKLPSGFSGRGAVVAVIWTYKLLSKKLPAELLGLGFIGFIWTIRFKIKIFGKELAAPESFELCVRKSVFRTAISGFYGDFSYFKT